MKGIDQKELEQKLNLVIEKLMHLGGPEDEADLEAGGEKREKSRVNAKKIE